LKLNCIYSIIQMWGIQNTYGIIAYNETPSGIIYNITQRRDTLAYIQFIKGCPDDKVQYYFERMTRQEKEKISIHKFEDLWNDLWNSSWKGSKKIFFDAKDTFERQYSSGIIQDAYAKTIHIEYSLEWGFPKGKKIYRNEPDVVSALREYREETGNKSYIEIVDMEPFICTYIGQTIKYYVAKSKYPYKANYYVKRYGCISRKCINDETNASTWLSFEECEKVLPEEIFKVVKDLDNRLKYQVKYVILQDVVDRERKST